MNVSTDVKSLEQVGLVDIPFQIWFFKAYILHNFSNVRYGFCLTNPSRLTDPLDGDPGEPGRGFQKFRVPHASPQSRNKQGSHVSNPFSKTHIVSDPLVFSHLS